jgi:hypothetical protein
MYMRWHQWPCTHVCTYVYTHTHTHTHTHTQCNHLNVPVNTGMAKTLKDNIFSLLLKMYREYEAVSVLQAVNTDGRSAVIAPRIHSLSTWWTSVVSFTLQPPYPRKGARCSHQTRGWVSWQPVWTWFAYLHKLKTLSATGDIQRWMAGSLNIEWEIMQTGAVVN